MQHSHLHHAARAADGTKMIDLIARAEADWSSNVKAFIHKKEHNTNSEVLKMNVPADFDDTVVAQKDSDDSGVATAVSVVYVTMSPTFSGSVLGYITQTVDPNASSTAALISTTSAVQVNAAASTGAASSAGSTTIAAAASSSTGTYTPMVGTPIYATRQTSSTAIATNSAISESSNSSQDPTISQQQTNSGLTDGAKAGLAIGIILALALAAGLIFFCYKRQKKASGHEELNEKSAHNEKRTSFFGSGLAAKRTSADSDKSFGTIHNTATAPRLSLRPVTQFLPSFGEKRKSGNLLGGPQMSEQGSAWERRLEGAAQNPFSDKSEKQNNPFDEADARSISPNSTAKQSMDGSASEPQTPRSVGTATAVPVGQAPRGPNNVHRVQLDFKPSMDDELELKSGQLVRMLHEYDDGWVSYVVG